MIAEEQENQGYFVTDVVGRRVEVCFEPLTADDSDTLNGEDWQGARFGDVWKEWAEHNIALKLVRCDDSEKSILGIVKIGTMEHRRGKPDVLRHSLLEAAPQHKFRAEARQYHGIGRVLVARLIVESKGQGARGRVLVRPVFDSIAFYERLGFRPSSDRNYILEAEKPDEVLMTCMTPLTK